jgi:RNA polymerase sigma-70 factor (ECF subfamily)
MTANADADLVAALRRDDPDAVEQLFERYGDRIYQIVTRVAGGTKDVEDVVQQVLWTAITTIRTFGDGSSFGSWIDRIAAAAAYDKLRSQSRSDDTAALDDVVPPLDDDGQHFAPMTDWSSRLHEPAARRAVSAALEALPAEYRAALALHDVGLATLDIAKTLGVSPAAAKSRVHRARLFVRKRLSAELSAA